MFWLRPPALICAGSKTHLKSKFCHHFELYCVIYLQSAHGVDVVRVLVDLRMMPRMMPRVTVRVRPCSMDCAYC